MNKKIFRSSFLVAVIVLIVSIIMILGILFDFFESRLQNEMKNEANYISHAVENEGPDFFNNFESGGKRITLIRSDGSVIFDNVANAENMDNHSDRDEIEQAKKYGDGISTRYSDTLTQKTVYYAVKLNNGDILRISANQYTIFAIFINLLKPLFIVLIIAFVLSFLLSLKISKSIIKPINNIDLNNPENNIIYEELSPLLAKILSQKRTINEQLKEAGKKREQFRLITENMSEGFLIIDKNAALLTYNTAAVKLFDIDASAEGSVLTLNRTKDFRDVIEKSLDGNRAESIMTYGEYSYNLIANPVFEDDKIIGAVIVIIDVTENVKRESLRREFTANVSHELKTPLTSVSGFAELMMAGGTPDETVVDFSKSIYDEAQRLITLVNDIIKISELDEKSIEYKKENVDIFVLTKEIIECLRSEIDKKNISVNLQGNAALVWGVKTIIYEMIYNLCDNAVKYNKERGEINITIYSENDKVKISVKDTGIGIPLRHQKRVFERFYRVDKSHSKMIGGTGLGLAIVKHGAIYHNADISLESTENKGTSVTISFYGINNK
ncbi:MAG: histidine kinase [Clostridiales bacterium]|nr:histidine kinase [Clostridiales bacterium]